VEIIKLDESNTKEVADRVAEIVLAGGLVVYPTDTLYGLGVDATNEIAVEKLWKFKGERENKPVLIAVNSEKMAEKFIEITELGKKIIHKYWPGPVSIVGKSKNLVAMKVQGEKGKVGVRMPGNKFVACLVKILDKPITSTSANITGAMTCVDVDDFSKNTPPDRVSLVDCFVDAGIIERKLPSTIVDISEGEVKILRQGAIEICL